MHLNIFDEQRLAILPLLAFTKADHFYLAGGTALALQLGHRDSIDFDFFTENEIDTKALFEKCKDIFKGHSVVKVQEEKNTLGLLIDDVIRLSFMTYSYPLIKSLIESDYFSLASITDIGCMKLSAITSRSVMKDYVDLYFIAQQIPFKELLVLYRTKYTDVDISLVLKSVVYFEDVKPEHIMYKENNEVPFTTVKVFLRNQARGMF